MKKAILWASLIILSCACSTSANEGNGENKIYKTEHFNIIIAPDLSNRVDFRVRPKPLKDLQIANVVLNNLYPKILNSNNRSENQKDKVRLDFINKGLINEYKIKTSNLYLNFEDFPNQGKRMDYIKGRSERKLDLEVNSFLEEYSKIHRTAENKNFGADIWSYLKGLDNTVINTSISVIPFKSSEYHHSFKNVIVLLTDGYIEAGLYGQQGCKQGNQCYYLSSDRIKEFRYEFKKSGEKDFRIFYEKYKYGIVPVDNPILENVEILALEFNDRTLDKAGNASIFPTDYDILELFWTDWMKKSGVKKFKMKRTLNSEKDAEKEIFDFMGIKG